MQLQSVPGEPVPPFDPPVATSGMQAAGDHAAAELARRGTILVPGKLDDEAADRVTAQVLAATSSAGGDGRITLRLAGTTGSVAAALALHDLLVSLQERPAVVATGMIDTAGALLLAAGARGQRAILPHASVHLTRITEPSLPAAAMVPVEVAAADVDAMRRAAESILGVDLSKPRLLSPADAVAAGIADTVG